MVAEKNTKVWVKGDRWNISVLVFFMITYQIKSAKQNSMQPDRARWNELSSIRRHSRAVHNPVTPEKLD